MIDTLLAVGGQKNLEVYLTINIIAYLVVTLLYVYLNPRARRALNTISMVLFGAFLVVVAIKVMEVLRG